MAGEPPPGPPPEGPWSDGTPSFPTPPPSYPPPPAPPPPGPPQPNLQNYPVPSHRAPARPSPPYIPVARSSGTATASLVCGIVAFFCGGCLVGIVAIFLGHMALSEIRNSDGLIGGEGMAKAGLILGWINVGLSILGACGVVLMWVVMGGFALATGGGPPPGF